jgi:hypothetical protein
MATLVRSLPTRPRDSTFSAPAPPLSPAALDGGRPLSGRHRRKTCPTWRPSHHRSPTLPVEEHQEASHATHPII